MGGDGSLRVGSANENSRLGSSQIDNRTNFGASQFSAYGEQSSSEQPIVPIEGFGDVQQHEENIFEGQCWLKTKTDRYKEHWAVLAGNELYCYRYKGDTEHRVMHSMIGTFIKEMPKEFSKSENADLFPVKIMLPPNKSRILYFKS